MNNRLDYITSFKNKQIADDEMNQLRSDFIKIDDKLRLIASVNESHDAALVRSVSLARTHLEQAQMHAIKALCLKHENKA